MPSSPTARLWMRLVVTAVAILTGAELASAQPYAVDWHVVPGGGHAGITGGPYSLQGSIGQAGAGGPFSSGGYAIAGGFWTATVAAPVAPALGAPSAANITSSAADLGGDVLSDGGNVIVERGIVLAETSIDGSPEIGEPFVTKVISSGTLGAFSVSVGGLSPSTSYSFRAFATNSVGTTYSATGAITTLAPPCPLITLDSLQSGLAGQPYSDSAAASGGLAPYSYALIGSLPDGLTLDGTTGSLTGNPVLTSAATFEVKATDANGCQGSRVFKVAIGSLVAPSDLVIREFRWRGPGGGIASAASEYVVLHNRTNADLMVASVDSDGFSVATSDGALVFTIPNGTVLKAKGHFLGANVSNGPTILGVTPDASWTSDVADTNGLALFRSETTRDGTTVLDAVGVAGSLTPFAEGATLPGILVGGEFAWIRKATTGPVADSGSSAADFVLVAVDGAPYGGVASVLGSPRPTGSDVVDASAALPGVLIEPLVGANNFPNRFRTGSGNSGTLEFRRRVTNQTASTVSNLRFRVVQLTTFKSPGYATPTQADLRLASGGPVSVAPTSIGVSALQGLTLELPALAGNGGWNAIATVATPPLAPNATLDISIVFNIHRAGSFKFLLAVETQ